VDACVLELVLVFIVEHKAVLIKKAHNGCLPAGAPQKVDDDIEEPVL